MKRIRFRSHTARMMIVMATLLGVFVTLFFQQPISAKPSAQSEVDQVWQRAQEIGTSQYNPTILQSTSPTVRLETADEGQPTVNVAVDVPTTVSPGQTVTAKVTLTNTTAVALLNVIPAGFVPQRTTHVSGGTVDTTLYTGYTYTKFSFARIESNQSITFEHSFKIPTDAQEGATYNYEDIYVQSSPEGSNMIYTQFPTLGKKMTIPVTNPPPLFNTTVMNLVVTAPTPLTQGGNVEITLEAKNTGTDVTPALTFFVAIPTGTTYVSGGTLVPDYNFFNSIPPAPYAKFEADTFAAGETKVLKYVVTVPNNPPVGTVYPISQMTFEYPEGGFTKGQRRSLSTSMIVEAPATTVASYKKDDTTFSTPIHGFGFPNYGSSTMSDNDLTAVDIFNMFGPQVCKSGNTAETCKLTAAAEKRRLFLLNSANGGHCEGMAVVSLRLFEGRPFNGKSTPADFGAPQTVGLSRTPEIKNYIMHYFALQYTTEVSSANERLKPSEIVNKLIQDFNSATPVGYTVGIYKPGYKEGHAITAKSIEKVDENNYRIVVYDNNFPKQRKYIEVNMADESWRYSTAANPGQDPSAYIGDADTKTLEISPISVRDLPSGSYFACNFCNSQTRDGSESPITISYSGEGDILIIDNEKRATGYDFFDTNDYVNEIPDVVSQPLKLGLGLDVPPEYTVPHIPEFYEIYVGARSILSPTNGSLTIHGEGFMMGFDYIELPADGSTYRFQVSPDGETLFIDTDEDEDVDVVLPSMYIAFDPETKNDSSIIFELDGLVLAGGETAIIELNPEEEWVYFETTDPYENYFDLLITEIDSEGNTFEGETTVLTPPNLDFAYVDFSEWDGTGKIPVVIEQIRYYNYLPMLSN